MIKNILVSQQAPSNMAPYAALSEKFGVDFVFKPFFLIEPLTSREFRAQRLNILDFTAITFSSRHAIDAFFRLCEELRVKVPETMKYFCTTEHVAIYLQKHIVYRKRKIFFGDGSADSILAQIGNKHKGEKFLITTSDTAGSDTFVKLFEAGGLDYKTGIFIKSVSQDIKDLDIKSFDMVVLYNTADLKSLYENFPDFKQEGTKFMSYGKSIVKAMEEAGLQIEMKAPTAEAPSVSKALELYLSAQK